MMNKYVLKRIVVVLVVGAMLVVGLVGCNETENTVAETEESIEQELVSSEGVSELVSETACEEVSEVFASEPTDEEKIMEIMLKTYENMPAVIDAMTEAGISEPKFIVMNATEMKLMGIYDNGSAITLYEGDILSLYNPSKIDEVSVGVTNITAVYVHYNYAYALSITGKYTDLEVPVMITDVNGIVYEMTFIVTTEQCMAIFDI